MKLFEIFTPSYVVKKHSPHEYDVTKFSDRKEPDHSYRVEIKGRGRYWTDSPGFIHRGQDEKPIKIVKQFIADGEPHLTAYQVDDKGVVTSKRFGMEKT